MKTISIIGGGIAGLTAGIYAQKYGFKATIYEKNAVTGGQCTGWNRQGYHIDNCIHWLTGTKKDSSLYKLWEDTGALGAGITLRRSESYGVYSDGVDQVTIYNDIDKLRQELLRVSPEDRERIEELMNDLKTAGTLEMPADKPMDMYSPIELIKLGLGMKDAGAIVKKYAGMSCEEYANGYRSERLRYVFSSLMPEGYSMQAMIFTLATLTGKNGDIPAGGSLAMAQRMTDQFKSLGGTVVTGAPVADLIISKKKVEALVLENGDKITSDYVIAACDVEYTYHKLLKGKYNDKIFENRWKEEMEEHGTHPAPTSMHVSFGINMDLSSFPVCYQFQTKPFQVATTMQQTIGIRHYSYEPSFAPAGSSIINVFISQYDKDYLYWESLYADHEAYMAEKNRIALEVQKRIEEEFKEWAGKLTILDTYTPVTYHNYCNAYHGAWMSFIMSKSEKQYMHKGIIKGLGNCFLAGMWLQPPGGLPVAAVTGKSAVQRICKLEKIQL